MSEKKLTKIKRKISGRSNNGQVSTHHRGGGEKRKLRKIDWQRDKKDVVGIVESIEYDPNRTADLALLFYRDGDKRYILAPEGLQVGNQVVSSTNAEAKVGNHLPMENVPVGMPIHNLELVPGKGAQLVRSAGASATILSKEGGFAAVRLPSSEVRRLPLKAWATIGRVGNIDHKDEVIGKAGRKRHMGIRPTVRGVAQNPHSHPHGGGEGRSPIGMPSPKSPWGKKTLGKRTRSRRKWSTKYIIKRRKQR
ncbi:MAG: 50S ribosomal protein L2 [bacterium]|nr:50S ribosomal protein L2 [bacterium]